VYKIEHIPDIHALVRLTTCATDIYVGKKAISPTSRPSTKADGLPK
jgi:hypothetical protein